nr:MAG TPA: hypothetical protein [Caudoviricetes sp.]
MTALPKGATISTAASGGNREKLLGQRPAGCKQQRSRRWEPQPGCEAPIGRPGSSALDEKGPVKNRKGGPRLQGQARGKEKAMEEKKNVRIRLFKDNSRYKGDLFVSVNGVNYKIRRGVEVEVPPEVAEVLEHSQQQDEYTAARIAAAETAAQ